MHSLFKKLFMFSIVSFVTLHALPSVASYRLNQNLDDVSNNLLSKSPTTILSVIDDVLDEDNSVNQYVICARKVTCNSPNYLNRPKVTEVFELVLENDRTAYQLKYTDSKVIHESRDLNEIDQNRMVDEYFVFRKPVEPRYWEGSATLFVYDLIHKEFIDSHKKKNPKGKVARMVAARINDELGNDGVITTPSIERASKGVEADATESTAYAPLPDNIELTSNHDIDLSRLKNMSKQSSPLITSAQIKVEGASTVDDSNDKTLQATPQASVDTVSPKEPYPYYF